jgi:hypothetical protein
MAEAANTNDVLARVIAMVQPALDQLSDSINALHVRLNAIEDDIGRLEQQHRNDRDQFVDLEHALRAFRERVRA